MNYVLGSCFTCGRITAKKFLRVKKLIEDCLEGTRLNRILVCTICEKRLQLPKGVEGDLLAPTL